MKSDNIVNHRTFLGHDVVIYRTDMGHLCGYVAVRPDSWFYRVKYDDKPTFIQPFRENIMNKPTGKRGIRGILDVFIMAAEGDDAPIRLGSLFNVHGSLTYSNDHKLVDLDYPAWWLGFDCGHSGDNPDDQTEAYVMNELRNLVHQINEAEQKLAVA